MAFCEVVQNIMYVAEVVMALGKMVTFAVGSPQSHEPVVWFLFYIFACTINLTGGNVFLKTNVVLGVVSLGFILMYIFISIRFGDFNKYALEEPPTSSGHEHSSEEEFLRHMPLTAWFYIGIEILPFAAVYCSRVSDSVSCNKCHPALT